MSALHAPCENIAFTLRFISIEKPALLRRLYRPIQVAYNSTPSFFTL